MTITDRNDPVEPQGKLPMSPRTRTAIAAGGLLLCLLIGGGIIYWQLFGSSPKRRVVQVDPEQQVAAGRQPNFAPRGARAQRRDAPGIHKGDDEWIVRGATGEMRVGMKATGASAPTYRFPGGLKLAPEQVSLLAGQWRILHDEAMAEEWKVTAEQVARLKRLQVGRAEMTPSQPQRQELWDLWTNFQKASGGQAKIDAQKKLLDKLDEVAIALLEPTRTQFAARLDQIKTILTPEQVQAITRR